MLWLFLLFPPFIAIRSSLLLLWLCMYIHALSPPSYTPAQGKKGTHKHTCTALLSIFYCCWRHRVPLPVNLWFSSVVLFLSFFSPHHCYYYYYHHFSPASPHTSRYSFHLCLSSPKCLVTLSLTAHSSIP